MAYNFSLFFKIAFPYSEQNVVTVDDLEISEKNLKKKSLKTAIKTY